MYNKQAIEDMQATIKTLTGRLDSVESENRAISSRMRQMQSYIEVLEEQINRTDVYATELHLRLFAAENGLEAVTGRLNFIRSVVYRSRDSINKTRSRIRKADSKIENVGKKLEHWKNDVNALDQTFIDVRGT